MIFRDTFGGFVPSGAPLRRRGAVWHRGPSERAADRDRARARGADRVGQDRDPAVTQPGAAGTRRPRGGGGVAGRCWPHPGAHPADPRHLRHRQAVRREDAVPGTGARRQQRRDRHGHGCEVVAVENEDNAIAPRPDSTLYSQRAPYFVSENAELKTAMAAVSAACEGRGVWVVDRGGDRGEIYADLLAAGRSFIIRQKGDRHLRWGFRTSDQRARRRLPAVPRHPHRARAERPGGPLPPRLLAVARCVCQSTRISRFGWWWCAAWARRP